MAVDPKPSLYIGGKIETISLGAGGTGYTAEDIITVVQAGGALGTVTVNTVDGAGVILTITRLAKGSGYAVANGLAVTGGTGTAATINILTISDEEITAINYGTGNAGSFLPSAAGQEYRVWNDKGKVETSSPMTSVLVTTRDSDGLEVLNLVTQNWIEIKSTTIHAGADGGSIAGYTDDNMPDFQPVGKDNFVVLGNIPYDCYRKILVRMKIPTSGLKAGVTFKIYVTNQQAQSSIANYITTIHGNGVIYQASGAFAVSINGGDASLLDIEKGFSLITNSRVYYGNSQQYDISGLANGTYKIYLTQAGAISSILEASAIPANSIELTRAVVAGAICTGVTDKRLFLANVMVGLDAAKTATPTINQVYIATDTEKMYICWVDDAWTQVIPIVDGVTKTGDFTAGKLVKINNASGIVEMASNTDTEVADAVTKKHTQHTDTGTTQTTFQIDSGNTGPKVKNNAGVLEARNAADDAYVAFKALLLTLVEGIDLLGTGKEILAKVNTLSFTEQVLTSGAAIAWDLRNGNKAILVAAHNHTVTITKPSGAIGAVLIITQDGTGSRVLDEIITQKDDSIATTDVHADTEIIDIGIDIPTGARIRFKTSAADLPDPLVVDTIYYAIRISATEIKVATTPANAFAGTAIDITDQGTGTHEVQQLVKWPSGTLGVLQTAAGAEDIIKLHYKTSDEQWYAELVANFS